MQDVDRPSHVDAFSEPEVAPRLFVQAKAPRVVRRPQRLDGICRNRGGWRYLRQQPAIGPPEPQRPVRLPRDLVALLVYCPLMLSTEEEEICQRGGPALRPVPHVMPLADPHMAAREATRPVPVLQRPPQRGRNRP